jgi:hypothetical protein
MLQRNKIKLEGFAAISRPGDLTAKNAKRRHSERTELLLLRVKSRRNRHLPVNAGAKVHHEPV